MNWRFFALTRKFGIVNAVLPAMLLAVVSPSLQATSLVSNGNFESLLSPGFAAEFGTRYPSQQVTGWSTDGYNFVFTPGSADSTGAQGEYNRIYLWGPGKGSANGLPATSPAGGNFLAFDGAYAVGPLTQTITGLTAGNSYSVSFYYAAAQQYGYNGATTEQFKVSLGGQTDSTPILSIPSHGFSGWTHDSLTFKATSTSEVLSFLAQGTPNGVPPFALLDGVTMNATVPEPATWTLLGLGIFGAFARFAYLRRRTKTEPRP